MSWPGVVPCTPKICTALSATTAAMAKPESVSISGLVIASSRAMAFARFSTWRTALFMRLAMRSSSAKALMMRIPVEVSWITLMISASEAISCSMIARTLRSSTRMPKIAAGPIIIETADRIGCW